MLLSSEEEWNREKSCSVFIVSSGLYGRCPLTCWMVRLSHSVRTSVEQSRVCCAKHTNPLKTRKKKNPQPFMQTLSQFPFVHALASNIYFGVGQRGRLAACLPSGVESFAWKGGKREHQNQIEGKTKSPLCRVSPQLCEYSGYSGYFPAITILNLSNQIAYWSGHDRVRIHVLVFTDEGRIVTHNGKHKVCIIGPIVCKSLGAGFIPWFPITCVWVAAFEHKFELAVQAIVLADSTSVMYLIL